jgi:4-hydroxy-tetrahydrodipicolinate synthase
MKASAVRTPGLLVAPLTPFDQDLKLDIPSLRSEIDYVVNECNAAMVIAAGVEAQEYHYLSMADRRTLIKETIAAVDKRCPVGVGVSHASFKTSIELAHYAQELGAEALQILAPLRPFGGVAHPSEVISYFELISKETDLPIILYLNAGPGADLTIPQTIELAQLEKITMIKESSRDLSRVSQLIEKIQHVGLAQYFTTMQMLLISLQLGGAGATMPPPAAELANLVVQAFLKGDYVEAARLQRQFALFPANWMHRGLTPTMKQSMKYLGRSIGEPYPPFGVFTDKEREDLVAHLKTLDLKPKI